MTARLAIPEGMSTHATAASPDGRQLVRSDLTGQLDEPESLGVEVAHELNRRGADLLLTSTEP